MDAAYDKQDPQDPEAQKVNPQTGQLSSEKWLNEISASERGLRKWHEQARRIVKRFLDH